MRLIFLAACVSFFSPAAHCAVPQNWRYYQPVQIDTAAPSKIKLSPDLLNAASIRFADLRLVDEKGEEQPYVLEIPAGEGASSYAPEEIRVTLLPSQTEIVVKNGQRKRISAVLLQSPIMSFMKGVSISVSQNGRNWQHIADGRPIFRQACCGENLAVDFPAGEYPYLNLRIDDSRTAPIPVTGATLLFPGSQAAEFDSIEIKNFSASDARGRKEYRFALPSKNLYVYDISMVSPDQVFSRAVSIGTEQADVSGNINAAELGAGTIYRLSLPESPVAERVQVPVQRYLDGARNLTVSLAEADGQPITFSAFNVRTVPVYLKFFPQKPGTYALCAGNPSARRPEYDLDALKSRIAVVQFDPVTAGPLQQNPGYVEAEPAKGVVDAGNTIDVSQWKYRVKVEPPAKGIQFLELTPAVLSASEYSLVDIRLVAEKRQVPYVIDPRADLSKPMSPQVSRVEKKNDRSNLAVWQLVFPYAGLPVFQIDCAAPPGVFSRAVRVYEYVKGSRGEKLLRQLGSATWSRLGDRDAQRHSVMIQRPKSDTLYLEMDNADNAALELSAFSALYKTHRLLFKTTEPSEIWLYYGNPQASAPRYDIALAAGELASSPQTEARLAQDNPAGGAGGAAPTLSKLAKIGLWILLLLVAGVMIAVIVKLLPESKHQ